MRAHIDLLESRTLLSNDFAGDFDGDGDQDLVFQTNTPSPQIWVVQEGKLVSSSSAEDLIPTGFKVRGVADVNGDGTDDIVLYSPETSVLSVWLMTGGRPSQYEVIGQAFGWHPAAFGDVNGDGTDDVIWQNHLAGVVGAWTLLGGKPTGWITLGQADLANWRLRDAADINGDGRDDVVWTSIDNTSVGVWLVGDGGAVQFRSLGTTESRWQYFGIQSSVQGEARIFWHDVSMYGNQYGFWSIRDSGVTFEPLPVFSEPNPIGGGDTPFRLADVDGDHEKDVLLWNGDNIDAYLLRGSNPALVLVGVKDFKVLSSTELTTFDLYTVSQSPSPNAIPIGESFQCLVTQANAGEPYWTGRDYVNTGQSMTVTERFQSPSTSGPFSIGGGPIRIAYDPAVPSDLEMVSVTGLGDSYGPADVLSAQVTLGNNGYNPNGAFEYVFSSDAVIGNEDDYVFQSSARVKYGKTVTFPLNVALVHLPPLQGNYVVAFRVQGTTGNTQWNSPQPVHFANVPALSITESRFDRRTYVYDESVPVDVVVTNNSDVPFTAGVPMGVAVQAVERFSGGPMPTIPRVISRVEVTDTQGFAPHESRTFHLVLPSIGHGAYLGAEVTWPGGGMDYEEEYLGGVVPPQTRYVMAADLDGDGDDDLVYENRTTAKLEAWMIQDALRTSTEILTDSTYLLGTGDLDGDRRDEVVFTLTGHTHVVDGNGTPKDDLLALSKPIAGYPVAVGDIDGNGVAEIIWRLTDDTIRASLRQSDGTFIWRTLGVSKYGEWSLDSMTDLDGDGDDDVLWRRYLDGSYHIAGAWLVDDSGSQWLSLEPAKVPVYGDLNGDGRTDLLTKRVGVFYVHLTQPDLTQNTHAIDRAESGWRLIAAADINNDGTDDLLWRSPDHLTVKAELMRDGAAYQWQTVFSPDA